LRGLRAFRVEKIAKNLALLDRLQNFAEFLHGLGRFDPFATPFGDDRYLRIPAEDWSRRKALVAALIDSQLAQELPLAMVGERRPWVGETPPGHDRYLREAEH
jgi:hypothetical protein